ncbi:unnamed protein product [Hermetia illucens]|uniref:Uncharacterized protein n=1 Tax=Hermetia illucens TaxID=343691 RepID=A0A7R8UBS0_HERIL|nr:zinc finger and SCAN domain-containing protein 12 [Hermetia illucens]CAD7077863.1 unnamed protein product [Hermetia illucens]
MDPEAEVPTERDPSQPDLAKICRLCLAEELGTVRIFNANENTNIPLQIMACAALEVHLTDALPKQICNQCRIQLVRFYCFRKRCQISDVKLRKHIRLTNAGKVSHVFKPKDEEDDDDDDEKFKDSLNLLKEIEKEEQEKQSQRDAELEEKIRQKLREEETNKIFEEAITFFNNKISNKSKARSANDNETSKAEASTSAWSDDKRAETEEQSNPVFEELVDSTETVYIASLKDDGANGTSCYMMKVNSSNDADFEMTEDKSLDNQEDCMSTYTVVKVEDNMEYETLEFNHEIENSESQMQQDSDEYNEEPVSIHDENSNASNIQTYAVATGEVDAEQDQNQDQDQELAIDILLPTETDENDEQGEGGLEDKYEVLKLEEYLDENSETHKQNQTDYSDLIEVSNPTNAEQLKIFKCPKCPQAFTRRAQLLRHASVHDKVRGYQCEHCKKWFACKSSMDRHIRIHTGEKPFQCDKCSRRFIQKEILKRHMAIHTGEKPFQCPQCDKSFVQRLMLTQHINLKHTENPVVQMHECSLCPKSFCHASGLSRHLLSHSGVTYTCKICDKKFSDKSAVKRHTSSVHM